MTADGTGPEGLDFEPTFSALDSTGAPLPPVARLLLADELSREEKPRQGDRVLLLGIVWDGETLIELQRIAKGGHLKLGDLSELPASHLPPQFRLVGNLGEELCITVPDSFASEVHEPGQPVRSLQSLAEAGLARKIDAPFKGHAYTVELADRVVVQVAPRLSLIARYVRTAPSQKRGLAEQIDVSFAATLVIALLALGLFFLVLQITPRWDALFGNDLTRNQARLTNYTVKTTQETKFTKVAPAADAPKAQGPEGKAGTQEATQAEAARSKGGAAAIDKDKRARDSKAIDTGLLLALNNLKAARDSATSEVLGSGVLGGGVNDALSAVKNGPTGDASGNLGLGTRGSHDGGGGTTKTIGDLGTGNQRGSHGLSLATDGPGKQATEFIPGKTTIVGGLSRDVINRIIQRHYNEIKSCYEKELSRDPSLYGKVEVLFQIASSGLVADAQIQETSMANEAVESCIVNHVRRWAFPAAQGITQVSYPYVFKATGQ